MNTLRNLRKNLTSSSTSPLSGMLSFPSILLVALAATFINAATLVDHDHPRSDPGTLDLNGTQTDTANIVGTLALVDQKRGPGPLDRPGQPVPATSITALDGELVHQPVNATARRSTSTRRQVSSRLVPRNIQDNFVQVFAGYKNHDGSIEGTAYLTFTTVPNSTYNIRDCLAYCYEIKQCVFANLYYEYNNPSLDASSSNLKCAVYGDVHTAQEKINLGGQDLYNDPNALTWISQSSGWALKEFVDPKTPENYDPLPPLDGANNAPGYMGFAFLDRYDVDACASLCDARGPDGVGGVCQYFNIWGAVVNNIPTTYTCAMYFIAADPSTAVNYGQGDLRVTNSRGYVRKSFVLDGGFESYDCEDGSDFCFDESNDYWIGTSSPNGHWDSLIFSYVPYAHSGHSVATFGSGDGVDSLPGSYTPKVPLATKKGETYCLQFWHTSSFNGELEGAAFLEVFWNEVNVASIRQGPSPWTRYSYTLVAAGEDVLKFTGGSYPAYDFIDDVGLYEVADRCPV